MFAGNGYVVNKTGADPYKGIDVKGKIVVVAGLPPEVAAAQAAGRGGRGGGGAAPADPLGEACKDYWTPEQYADKNGALAVVTVANFQTATAMAYPNAGRTAARRRRWTRRRSLNGPPYTPVQIPRDPHVPRGAQRDSAGWSSPTRSSRARR